MHWIKNSFKHQVLIILSVGISLFTFSFMLYNYTKEKKQLNNILESQVLQLNHRFALSLANNVFYNELYDISDAIFNLYEYNHKTAKKSGALFTIKEIAVVNKEQKIIGHSHPRDYSIGAVYNINKSLDSKKNDDGYTIVWSQDYKNLYIKTPIYFSQELIAYLYMNIDPLFLMQKEQEVFNQLMVFLLVFILALIVFSYVLASLIDKPMNEILQGLDDLGSGNVTFPLAMRREDEFFTLAKALTYADKRIAEQKEELIEIQVTLEDMVDERTEELNKTLEDMKKYQEQLVETEKMSALGSLVAGVAHEINTPIGVSLTGITYIESETKNIHKMMQEQTLGKNALREYLDTVVTMSESMHLSLVNAARLVRSFKQVAIDQHTEEKRHFNLREYFDEVLVSLNNKLKHEQTSIKNEIDSKVELYSYPGIFSQIFTNFIMNSLLHAFDESSKENEIKVKGWTEYGSLYITYEDNGKGIKEEHIKKIFDPFFTTKLGQGGSGLGLNIIYNLIVHKLKGDIYCINKERGMMMTITIPMQELEDE